MDCLYINACVRKDSRTNRLAQHVLSHFDTIEEVKLDTLKLKPLNESALKRRDRYIAKKDYSHAMFDLAHQFQQAEYIVIAAPYWDLSFPALLKTYLENIYVTGFGVAIR